jgi:SAM-dependent methyltransferase
MAEMDATAVRADFDRIACLSKHRASPSREESRLLSRVPEGSRHVLDVGSGLGVVARALSRRAETVVAIDFSREMVRRARAAVAEYPNVEVREADFMACDLPARSFDAIVSFATLHHLPFEAALERMAALLRPGGVLLVQDLFDASGFGELPYNAASYLARLPSLVRGRTVERELRAAWLAHAHHDHFMRLDAIRRRAAATLPGARVWRRLGWRYELEWRN